MNKYIFVKSNFNIKGINTSNFEIEEKVNQARKEKERIINSSSQKIECRYIEEVSRYFIENIIVKYDNLGYIFFLLGILEERNLLIIDITGDVSKTNLILFLSNLLEFVYNIKNYKCNLCIVYNDDIVLRNYKTMSDYVLF